MKRILLILCILFSFVFYANCKDKKKENKSLQAGIVTFSKGDTKLISKDGKEKKIQKDTFFFKDDTIVTGKDGIVDIQLTDGVVIRVKQNSKLKLQDIIVGDNGSTIKAKLKLETGKVFAKTDKKLNSDSSFSVATPTFVAGIRGTEFIVEDSEGKDQALVSDGAVSVEAIDENGKPTGKESIIEKGHKGIIEKDSIKNAELSPEELAELKEDSQSISSITEDARQRMQEIIRTLDDQKQKNKDTLEEQIQINRDALEEQMQKNNTELNELKDKNQQILDEQKEKNKGMMNETTGKTNEQKNEIKDNTKAQTNEVKDKGNSELEDMKNKNKIDKSQFGPK